MTSDAIVARVPLVDLQYMHRQIAAEVDEGLLDLMESGAFIGGPQVARFEEEFAAYSGRRHCVGAANGTDALEMAFRAADLGPGDEVIIPANTFVATAEAVRRAGAVPVCVDVTDDTLLLDPDAALAAITNRTRAIVPVHLFGQLAPVSAIHDIAAGHGLLVVEDAAQAQGATAGGAGIGAGSLAAATSFYPGKNLGAYGDAGALVCDDDRLAARLRRIGAHGSDRKYVHEEFGFNSRLDSMQAVVLSAKLRRLEVWNEDRRRAAAAYDELLARTGVRTPVTATGNVHVWHLYVIRVADRDEIFAALQDAGIGCGIHYPVPVHRQPAFAGSCPLGAPVAERAAAEMLSLPLFPGITPEDQLKVAETLRRAVG